MTARPEGFFLPSLGHGGGRPQRLDDCSLHDGFGFSGSLGASLQLVTGEISPANAFIKMASHLKGGPLTCPARPMLTPLASAARSHQQSREVHGQPAAPVTARAGAPRPRRPWFAPASARAPRRGGPMTCARMGATTDGFPSAGLSTQRSDEGSSQELTSLLGSDAPRAVSASAALVHDLRSPSGASAGRVLGPATWTQQPQPQQQQPDSPGRPPDELRSSSSTTSLTQLLTPRAGPCKEAAGPDSDPTADALRRQRRHEQSTAYLAGRRICRALRQAQEKRSRFPSVRAYGDPKQVQPPVPASVEAPIEQASGSAEEQLQRACTSMSLWSHHSEDRSEEDAGDSQKAESEGAASDGEALDVSLPWEEAYLRGVFKKFSSGDDREVHIDDLGGVLDYLGTRLLEEKEVWNMVKDITSYSSLSWQEFMEFLRRFREVDVQQLRNQFDVADLDHNGHLDEKELHVLLLHSGYSPTKRVTQQALRAIDQDGDGKIEFAEFEKLREYLRQTRGFMSEEAEELRIIFDRASNSDTKKLATEEVWRIKTYLGYATTRERTEKIVSMIDKDRSGELNFDELLQVIRRMQDAEFDAVCRIVEKFAHTADKAAAIFRRRSSASSAGAASGLIGGRTNRGTARPILKNDHFVPALAYLGYYTSQAVVDEILETFEDRDYPNGLTVQEMCDFLRAYRMVEGFTAREAAELAETFMAEQRVSVAGDNDETLDALELGRVLRWFGISKTLQQVRHLIDEVDFDGSQQLELREFLKLMRQFFQDEARQRREIFLQMQNIVDGTVTLELIPELIKMITGGVADVGTIARVLHENSLEETPCMNMEEFEFFFVHYRQVLRESVRVNQGYVPSEVLRLQAIFNSYDASGQGVLRDAGLRKLIQDHMPEAVLSVAGKEEMKGLLADLPPPAAASTAQRRLPGGLRGSTRRGQFELDFTHFLALMRKFYDLRDEKDIVHEAEAMRQCEYEIEEVEAWRDIFLSHVDSTGAMDLEMLRGVLSKIAAIDEDEACALSALMRKMSPDRREVARFPTFLLIIQQITSQNLFGLSATAAQLGHDEKVKRSVRMSVARRKGSMNQRGRAGRTFDSLRSFSTFNFDDIVGGNL